MNFSFIALVATRAIRTTHLYLAGSGSAPRVIIFGLKRNPEARTMQSQRETRVPKEANIARFIFPDVFFSLNICLSSRQSSGQRLKVGLPSSFRHLVNNSLRQNFAVRVLCTPKTPCSVLRSAKCEFSFDSRATRCVDERPFTV
jgi:hypothetical protein